MKTIHSLLIVIIFIFSGCSNYSNIPRIHKHFWNRSITKNTNETKPALKNYQNKEAIEIIKTDEIPSGEVTGLSSESQMKETSPGLESLFVIKNSRSKSNQISEKNIFSLRKDKIGGHIHFKSIKSVSSNKNFFDETRLPVIIYMLCIATAIIGFVFGIGYLSEKRYKFNSIPSNEKPGNEEKEKTKTWIKIFSAVALSLSILALFFLGAGIYAVITIADWTALIALLYLSVLSLISAILGVIFGSIVLNKMKDNNKIRKMASIAVNTGAFIIFIFIIVVGIG